MTKALILIALCCFLGGCWKTRSGDGVDGLGLAMGYKEVLKRQQVRER